jgi:hypothetical protein
MSAQIDISLRLKLRREPVVLPTLPEPVRPQLYRVKHDAELSLGIWRTGVPEVFRLSPWHGIPLNKEWQEFTYKLNLPGLTPEKWRVLYDYRRAFTNNGAGYDWNGNVPPKQDWVNMRDLTATDLPRFDGPRICGGAVVTGRVEGSLFWLNYLDANGPPPAVENVRPWEKFCATTVTATGVGKFPQRGGMDVIIPLIARQPVYLPMSNLQKWDAEELPDPYRIYL